MLNKKEQKLLSTRDGFGEAILALGQKNKNVVVVSADLAESTRVDKFGQKFPQRFFEVGVAEQNMAGIAAGLALEGKIPFITSFGVFSPGRNWDQIRVSIAYSQANVKIIASHTGLSVGEDGASHQALEDIALMRALPNMLVIAPADYYQTKKATLEAVKMKGPVYIRFARQVSPLLTSEKSPFQLGKAQIMRSGQDLTIVGCGPILAEAFSAAQMLAEKNISLE
ncbi:MAG: transketolase C-terminal domain-containing protein, partial [Patescibacteria group bacterium]|nr:transketolase C-terminal domain-containing protein [Patescibacteria group bacterium]